MRIVEGIETAADVRVVSFGGADMTEQCRLTGTIPRMELRASQHVAVQIARVEMLSRRSGLWLKVNIGGQERAALADGEPVGIDARVQYVLD